MVLIKTRSKTKQQISYEVRRSISSLNTPAEGPQNSNFNTTAHKPTVSNATRSSNSDRTIIKQRHEGIKKSRSSALYVRAVEDVLYL